MLKKYNVEEKLMNNRLRWALLFPIFVFLEACSSVDCPLNNLVHTQFKLAGQVTKLTDTLTVSTDINNGNDSVLINMQVNTDSFFLPISYQRPQDSFFFHIHRKSSIQTIDTIIVSKEDVPHFESIDCSPTFFHTITDVKTTHNAIDSIVINNPKVTYEANKAHLLIYFKTRVY